MTTPRLQNDRIRLKKSVFVKYFSRKIIPTFKKKFKTMKNKIIIQDNALTVARYEMSALEKNILYAVMAQINDSDSPNKCYKISALEIADSKGARVRRDYFQDAISKLLTREIVIKRSDGKKLQITVIASAEHDKDGVGVEIEISNKMRPYLFALKNNFTSFGLEVATSLNSKYSKRLYEMLCQFRSTGILRLTISELKDRFQLVDSEGNEQYARWSSFERCVLKSSQIEINEKANFQFDYELKKRGRKIIGVDFKFRKTLTIAPSVQDKAETPKISIDQSSDPKQPRTIERLTAYGMSDMQINTVLKKYTILQICKILYELDCNKANIQNTAAYLCKIFNL